MDTSPEIVLKQERKDKTDLKDKTDQIDKTGQIVKTDQIDLTDKDSVVQNAITANNQDIWPRTVPNNQLKKNAMAARRLVTLPETAHKVTKKLPSNATNATKVDILPNNARVIF